MLRLPLMLATCCCNDCHSSGRCGTGTRHCEVLLPSAVACLRRWDGKGRQGRVAISGLHVEMCM